MRIQNGLKQGHRDGMQNEKNPTLARVYNFAGGGMSVDAGTHPTIFEYIQNEFAPESECGLFETPSENDEHFYGPNQKSTVLPRSTTTDVTTLLASTSNATRLLFARPETRMLVTLFAGCSTVRRASFTLEREELPSWVVGGRI